MIRRTLKVCYYSDILATVNVVVIWLLFVGVATSEFSVAAETNSNNNNKIFLTSKNYREITSNKTAVLIKWAAPWCSHSQDLAPVWDKLVVSYGDGIPPSSSSSSSSKILLAEVDCGTGAEVEWCTAMGYTAFPTLTYGDPSMNGLFLQTYQSLDKSHQTLLRFVQDELVGVEFCTPGNIQACPPDTRTKLESFWNMTIESLEKSIKIENDEIQRLHNESDAVDQELKQKYNMIARQHQGVKADIKRRTKLLRNILKTKRTTAASA